MKWILAGAAAAVLPLCAVEHSGTVTRVFTMSGSERRLEISNINGDLRVSADNGNDVRVSVREQFKADTPEQLARARADVRLEMRQEGSTVRMFLDGPFRQERFQSESYRFRHDFDVQVPRDIDLVLRTVNGRELRVSGVRGSWNLRNVNGAIEMTDAAGSGSAETVNGQVRISFAVNPREASTFKTLNGSIDVTFQPELSADLSIATTHGEAYTDFEVAPLAVLAETSRTGEPFRYRMPRRSSRLRIGAGGVEHQFKTMNGSIRIRKYGK